MTVRASAIVVSGVVAAGLVLVLSGCGSSTAPPAAGAAAVSGASPSGSAGGPAVTASRSPSTFVIDHAALVACQTNKETVQEAVEEYYTINGAWPKGASGDSLSALHVLVDEGLLVKLPPATNAYALTYDGRTHTVASNLEGC